MHYIAKEEVAQRLGISVVTIYQWLRQSEKAFPKPKKFGRATRWSNEEVEAWIERQPRLGDEM